MRQHRVGGVDAAEPGVAEELLEGALFEDPEPAREVQPLVDYAPRAFHGVILGG